MSTGRRKKVVRELVREAEGTGTLSEKLSAANRILHESISPIDNQGRKRSLPDPLLIVDIHLTSEEYEWVIELLSEAVEGLTKYPHHMEKLFADYPMVFLAALAGTALLEISDSYWDDFWKKLDVSDSKILYNTIRKKLYPELKKKKFASFEDSDLLGREYVGSIQLHAGITARDLGLVIDNINALRWEGQAFTDSESFASFMVNAIVSSNSLPQNSASLRLLAMHLPERAGDIFARIYEFHDWFTSLQDKTEVDGFEGTHGLPEPTFAFLRKMLKGEVPTTTNDAVSEKHSYPSPFLAVNLGTFEFELVFPEISKTERAGRPAPEWTILIDESPHVIKLREDWSKGGFEEFRFPLTKPFAKLSITDPAGETSHLVEQLGRQTPALFLTQSGKAIKDQRKLNNKTALALMPSSTIISATTINNKSFVHRDIAPLHGWAKWVIRELPLEDVSQILLSHGGKRVIVDVIKFSDHRWSAENRIPHLSGLDHMPVLRASPRIRIPRDSNEWTLRYYQILGTGEASYMDSYTVEQHLRTVDFEVFDPAPDPWVGRYQVDVLRDGRLHDSRRFNLAEGLDLSLKFSGQQKFGPFQVPEQTAKGPGLSKAFAEFSSAHDAGLRHPLSAQAVHTEDPEQRFRIASSMDAESYYIDVKVNAPRLTYRLPLREEVSGWTSTLKVFNMDELSESEDFQLRFPTVVHDVVLAITRINGYGKLAGIERISLLKKGSTTWVVPVTRLTATMESDAEYAVVAIWKNLTVEEHLSVKLNTFERKNWWALPQEKRPDPRIESTVQLFRVTRSPLLNSAEIKSGQLTLKLGRNTDRPLETWVWSAQNPLDAPVKIVMNGRQGFLPAELVDEGPLIVEAREEEFLSFWEPTAPSSHAVVADQPFTLEPHLDVTNKYRWLFAVNSARELLPQEIQVVWEARDKMHFILGKKESLAYPSLRAFDEASSNYLLRNPRLSLEELDRSAIPTERHFEAFIRSDLVTKSFFTEDTYGDIHPVPWIGLIQELNDLKFIKGSFFTDQSLRDEKEESERYVKVIGGTELWRMFRGKSAGNKLARNLIPRDADLQFVRKNGTGQLQQALGIEAVGAEFISEESRLAAQIEWLENRRDLASDSRIGELFQLTSAKEYLIDRLDDPELKRTALDLMGIAESRRDDGDNWLYVPYISFVQSLLARMVAHGVISPIYEMNSLKHAWANLAHRAPLLTGFDLVAAEAIVLHASSTVENLIKF